MDPLALLCCFWRPPASVAGGIRHKLPRYFAEMKKVGGRGGTRTRGPLLAKQITKRYVVVSSSLYLCLVARFLMVFGSNCSYFVPAFLG